MKRIIRTIAIVLLCATLISEDVEARGRKDLNESKPKHEQTGRPGNNRPGNSGFGSNNNRRPGNGGQGNHNRPGHSNGNNTRPGNSNRPQHGGNRPGHNPGHHPGYQPAPPPRPNHNLHHGHICRPHLPPPRPFHRPVPPPHYRPTPAWRPFSTILGVALGTSINLSVNALINSGYNVAGYGSDMVYLNNVTMLNMLWPDATLYYNSYGGLYSSEFVYTSPVYDMSRYNMAMSRLTSSYGAPASIQNTNSGITATWWGGANNFIRLTYNSEYAGNGFLRYYTILSFGN